MFFIYFDFSCIHPLQGFNATLTESVDSFGSGGQIKEMELKLHPDVKDPLKKLSNDPNTTIVVLSGSKRGDLDNVLPNKILFLYQNFKKGNLFT